MKKYTALGIFAIILWSTCAPTTRILTEQFGGFLSCGIEMLISGLILTSVKFFREGSLKPMISLPKKYLFICGALFLLYMFGYYLSMELCQSRSQILVAGALNYLWPVFTVIFSIPLLKRRCSKAALFCLGIVFSIVGTFGVALDPETFDSRNLLSGNAWIICLLSIGAGISWGLYSVLVTKFLEHEKENAMCLFMLITGMITTVIGLLTGHRIVITREIVFPLIYAVIFPSMLAYWFWDMGMQNGDSMLESFFSLFTVVLSTIASIFILRIRVMPATLIFCVIIALGAVCCKISVREDSRTRI